MIKVYWGGRHRRTAGEDGGRVADKECLQPQDWERQKVDPFQGKKSKNLGTPRVCSLPKSGTIDFSGCKQLIVGIIEMKT